MSTMKRHPKPASPAAALSARQRADNAIAEILKVCDTLETYSAAEADLDEPMPPPSLEMLASLLRRMAGDIASAVAEMDKKTHGTAERAEAQRQKTQSPSSEGRSALGRDHAKVMHALDAWIDVMGRLSMLPAYSEINHSTFDPVLAEMKSLQSELQPGQHARPAARSTMVPHDD